MRVGGSTTHRRRCNSGSVGGSVISCFIFILSSAYYEQGCVRLGGCRPPLASNWQLECAGLDCPQRFSYNLPWIPVFHAPCATHPSFNLGDTVFSNRYIYIHLASIHPFHASWSNFYQIGIDLEKFSPIPMKNSMSDSSILKNRYSSRDPGRLHWEGEKEIPII